MNTSWLAVIGGVVGFTFARIDLLEKVVGLLWPFRIVEQWERGGYYFCGKWWREVKPGVKMLIPWFCDVKIVSVVPGILGTARLDITLSDNSVLTYRVSAWARIFDVKKALNEVDQYEETTQELMASVTAEKLATVDADRLTPAKRARLLSDLQKWMNETPADEHYKGSKSFGVEITGLAFTTFVHKPRTFRLLGEAGGTNW